MKRKMTVLVLILTMIASIKIVNAASVTSFPDSITVSYHELITRYDKSLYHKEYKTKSASGKAFCASFWRLAPSGTCSKMKWSNNNTQNTRIAAAVGYIINKARTPGASSITTDNYYYGEIAINRFLYKNFGLDVNNVSYFPQEILNKSNSYYANANAIYNDYFGNDTVKFTEVTLNGNSLKKGAEHKIESANKYILRAVMKCYDKEGGKQIKCDKPVSNGSYAGGTKSIGNPKVTYSGKDVIFTYDLTNIIDDIGTSQVKLNISNQKAYSLAQRYDCGNYQTMVPNYLVQGYSPLQYKTTNFSFKKDITPPPEKNCDNSITDDPAENAALYKDFPDKPGLLDVENPSCSGLQSAGELSCEESIIQKTWVDQVQVSGNKKMIFGNAGEHYSAYCKATYTFDNFVYMNNMSSKNNLLFTTKDNNDNVFGRAQIEVDCNVPILYGNNTFKLRSLDIPLSKIIPDIEYKIDFDGRIITGKLKPATPNISYGCENNISSDLITCKGYQGDEEGYGWNFVLNVDYVYDESNHYTRSDQDNSLINWNYGKESYGYGILVPDGINNISDGQLEITFDKDSKSEFSVENKKTSCSFNVQNEDIRKQIKYRTIDTKSPFNKINGKERYTGSNWCDTSRGEAAPTNNSECFYETDDEEDNEWKCYYYGDVDQDHEWTMKDSEAIGMYAATKITFNSQQFALCDVNRDTACDVLDSIYIQKIIVGKINSIVGDVNLDGIISEDDINCITNEACLTGQYKNKKLSGYQFKMADANGNYILDDEDIEIIKDLIMLVGSDSNVEIVGNSVDSSIGELKTLAGSDVCKVEGNKVVEKYITNRPNANGKKPIYTFTLDAKTIKYIRDYNGNNLLQDLYSNNQSLNASGLCIDQTTDLKYCNVEEALKTGGVIN